MSAIDNLLKKALSTSSEAEAIAALRMARKRNTSPAEFVEDDNEINAYRFMLARLDHTVAQQDIEIAGHKSMYTYMNKLVQKWQIAFGVVMVLGIIGWVL